MQSDSAIKSIAVRDHPSGIDASRLSIDEKHAGRVGSRKITLYYIVIFVIPRAVTSGPFLSPVIDDLPQTGRILERFRVLDGHHMLAIKPILFFAQRFIMTAGQCRIERLH